MNIITRLLQCVSRNKILAFISYSLPGCNNLFFVYKIEKKNNFRFLGYFVKIKRQNSGQSESFLGVMYEVPYYTWAYIALSVYYEETNQDTCLLKQVYFDHYRVEFRG